MPEGGAYRLLMGLGNPGPQYADTRHNAGVWLVDEIASRQGASWSSRKRQRCDVCEVDLAGQSVVLLKSHDYMNDNGRSLEAYCHYFRVPVAEVVVAYDDLDHQPGVIKCRVGGGHGGHNGLRSVLACLGQPKDLARLRMGIGHPGHRDQVRSYVLNRPSTRDYDAIHDAIDRCLLYLPSLLQGKVDVFMNRVHTPSGGQRQSNQD